jgi:4-hydroxythreonine-4-phosphate dehydrogenase
MPQISLKPFAITMGDPAGIGPEVIAKAFMQTPRAFENAFVVGDVATLRRAFGFVAGLRSRPHPVAQIEWPANLSAVPPGCLPVLQIATVGPLPVVGQISAAAGRAAGDCVLWAARAALRGELAAMVTAPLHKESLHAAGPPYSRYPGHTELLQAEAAVHVGLPVADMPVRMMLANDELKTVLVSIHLSLRAAIEAVTLPQVLETLEIAHRALRAMLGRAPKIAVAGLNPHAGEGGLFGREEIETIRPAIEAAVARGVNAHGPFAPDTIFMQARAQSRSPGGWDAVVAMYHDQGLIPVKYLGVEQGVNVTLGLPLVRTSPDHGTAFDIAGSGRADPASLLAALRMARQLVA